MGPTTHLVITSALVVLLDQASKTLAHAGLLGTRWVEPVINRDLALGLAGGAPSDELLLGVVLVVLVALVLQRRLAAWRLGVLPVALIIGGSLGNLLDRAVGGAVRDFIAGPGLVFNIADVALLAGVLLAVLPLLATLDVGRRDHGPKLRVALGAMTKGRQSPRAARERTEA